MNTYIVPIYYDSTITTKISKYVATSLRDCKEKIMFEFSDIYDESWDDWNIFTDELWDSYGICIGEPLDIEEI